MRTGGPQGKDEDLELSKAVAVAFVVGVAAAGCNGVTPDDDAAPEDTVTVEALDNEFSPAELEVPAGTVEITVDNTGQAPHTFTSDELGVDENVAAGQQSTFTVSAEPGTYEFVCTLHEALGMVGTLTVTD